MVCSLFVRKVVKFSFLHFTASAIVLDSLCLPVAKQQQFPILARRPEQPGRGPRSKFIQGGVFHIIITS